MQQEMECRYRDYKLPSTNLILFEFFQRLKENKENNHLMVLVQNKLEIIGRLIYKI